MKPLRTFRLEEYLGEWEFKVRHHLTASDAESITIAELLALGTDADREGFMKLPLSYIETWGTPELRAAVAGDLRARGRRPRARVRRRRGGALLDDAGAGRSGRPRRRDRAVLPGDGDGHRGDRRRGERPGAAPGGRLGARPRRAPRAAPPEPRSSSPSTSRTTRPATSRTRRPSASWWRCATSAASACSATRSTAASRSTRQGRSPRRPTSPRRPSRSTWPPSPTAFPGLRVGWLACRDRALLERLEKRKHYTSICNAGPAEYLAAVALRNREPIWARNRGIVAANRPLFDDFFARWADLFDWQPPVGGCVCFPRYKGGDVEELLRAAARRGGRPGPAGEHVPLGDRRRAQRTTSVSESAGSASRKASPPSTGSCAHRTKFAARGRFRTAAVRYLLPLPAALILGASGSQDLLG